MSKLQDIRRCLLVFVIQASRNHVRNVISKLRDLNFYENEIINKVSFILLLNEARYFSDSKQ